MIEMCVVCGKPVREFAPRCCVCQGVFCRGYCGTLPSHVESADGTVIYVDEIFEYDKAKCYRCQGIRPPDAVRQEEFAMLLRTTTEELCQAEHRLQEIETDSETLATWDILADYERLDGERRAASLLRNSLAIKWDSIRFSLILERFDVDKRRKLLEEQRRITQEGKSARRTLDDLTARCEEFKEKHAEMIEKGKESKLEQTRLQQRIGSLKYRISSLKEEISTN